MPKNKRQKICDIRIRIAVPMWLYNDFRIMADQGFHGRTISEVTRFALTEWRSQNIKTLEYAKELMMRKEGGINVRRFFKGAEDE